MQIGLEPTPQAYVQRLVAVFRMVRRVLRSDGTLWLNLGDSYNGAHSSGLPLDLSKSGLNGAQTSAKYQETLDQRRTGEKTTRVSGLKPKDLVGIPWRVAFALQADGWYLRSDIIWAKPNPMPESVTDRPTKAHEYVFLLTKRPRYYYDADAIREAHGGLPSGNIAAKPNPAAAFGNGDTRHSVPWEPGAVGRNVRSVWEIATQPFPEAHFATFPEELARRCILVGTSERGGCAECGAPWQRQTEREPSAYYEERKALGIDQPTTKQGSGHNAIHTQGSHYLAPAQRTTTGWAPSCACDAPARPQLVLDPFAGSGTTLLVARKHGRRGIGIDLSSEYLGIAARRLAQQSLFAEADA